MEVFEEAAVNGTGCHLMKHAAGVAFCPPDCGFTSCGSVRGGGVGEEAVRETGRGVEASVRLSGAA